MPLVSAPPLRLTPKMTIFIVTSSCLPARGSLLRGLGGPLAGRGGGSGGTSLPGGRLSLSPLASGSGGSGGEGSGGSLPVTSTSGEAGLDGNRALLLNTGELLLLNLLLSLSLGVAVCVGLLVWRKL
jgi:hypothetical protein